MLDRRVARVLGRRGSLTGVLAAKESLRRASEARGLRKRPVLASVLALLACVSAGTRANAQAVDLIDAAMFGSSFYSTAQLRSVFNGKADVNAKTNQGDAPLIVASIEGHADVVRLLLDAKADVNARAINGTTALIMASQAGHTDVVRLLLDAKADINAKSISGTTALTVASQNGHPDVAETLKSAGATGDVGAPMETYEQASPKELSLSYESRLRQVQMDASGRIIKLDCTVTKLAVSAVDIELATNSEGIDPDNRSFALEWSPKLRRSVKTQNPFKGELSHGIVAQVVH